jgi:hypothetical protein
MNIICKHCDTEYSIPIEQEDYDQWKKNGGYIQDIADYLEAWEREMLISSTCNRCWKKMFGSDDVEVYF